MRDITPDLCDKYESQVTLLNLPLQIWSTQRILGRNSDSSLLSRQL